jgi:hypothetical protein
MVDCKIKLREKLPTTNQGNDFVLNSCFREWGDHIQRNLIDRVPSDGQGRYEAGPDRELLRLCKAHAKLHRTARRGKETIMLTHPFYLQLTHGRLTDLEGVLEESNDYINSLLFFLNLRKKSSRVRVVALETVHHYAAATSLLLERGLVDRVIFTLYDQGYPLNPDELKIYGEDRIFLGGGYNSRCLNHSIKAMRGKLSFGKMWAIRELSLNSPEDCPQSLRVPYVRGLNPSRTISLQEAITKLKL